MKARVLTTRNHENLESQPRKHLRRRKDGFVKQMNELILVIIMAIDRNLIAGEGGDVRRTGEGRDGDRQERGLNH